VTCACFFNTDALTITQGATRQIVASNIVDGNGQPLDVTGWGVHAVIRRRDITGPIVAEWSTTPTGTQGTASVGGTTLTLIITPAMSAAWAWAAGVLQAEITEPITGRVERIIDTPVSLNPEAVTP